jgi:hypothetical protein
MICSWNGRLAAVASLGLLAFAPISLADDPPGGDKTRVNSNFKRVGNKATWTMVCSGEMTFDKPLGPANRVSPTGFMTNGLPS